MDRNIKIANELVRLAKNIVSDDELDAWHSHWLEPDDGGLEDEDVYNHATDYGAYKDFEKIKEFVEKYGWEIKEKDLDEVKREVDWDNHYEGKIVFEARLFPKSDDYTPFEEIPDIGDMQWKSLDYAEFDYDGLVEIVRFGLDFSYDEGGDFDEGDDWDY